MSNIVIVGAGRIGIACGKIIHFTSTHSITFVDNSDDVLASVAPQMPLGCPASTRGVYTPDQMEDTLRQLKPDVIICATPFTMNVQVAQIAQRIGSHYIDFTEDVSVTKAIEALGISRLTFVPQTGLAPGLISYLGLSLFQQLGEPSELILRVGALPQVAFGPAYYAITWSPEGLINEYLKPAWRKVGGIIQEVPSLSDEENLLVDGRMYEGFTTSGGVGNLAAYDHIPSVEYKTLRHPGHLEYIQKLLASSGDSLEKGVENAKAAFYTTRDDVVVLCAIARDADRRSATRGIHFYPHHNLGISAIELTTAGTGIAVLELILRGELAAGVLRPDDISYELLRTTKAYELIFSCAR
jgi:saccharopine dehydrogenase-like NADP-dependent oxidoreductase